MGRGTPDNPNNPSNSSNNNPNEPNNLLVLHVFTKIFLSPELLTPIALRYNHILYIHIQVEVQDMPVFEHADSELKRMESELQKTADNRDPWPVNEEDSDPAASILFDGFLEALFRLAVLQFRHKKKKGLAWKLESFVTRHILGNLSNLSNNDQEFTGDSMYNYIYISLFLCTKYMICTCTYTYTIHTYIHTCIHILVSYSTLITLIFERVYGISHEYLYSFL